MSMPHTIPDSRRQRVYTLIDADPGTFTVKSMGGVVLERVSLQGMSFIDAMNLFLLRESDAPNQPVDGFTPRYEPEIG